jgi:hypothetical protein
LVKVVKLRWFGWRIRAGRIGARVGQSGET